MMFLPNDSLEEYIERHWDWSMATFGAPKDTDTLKLCNHIAKEIREVLDHPRDPMEWADIIILAIDGAMRNGVSPARLTTALFMKQHINRERKWNIPEDPTQPNEHVR